MDIYDRDKKQWYRITRGILGLRLSKIIYERVIRCAGNGDLVYSDYEGLKIIVSEPPEIPGPGGK